jgi:hypothetical protein
MPDTPEWREAFEASQYFGTQVFYADDLSAAARGIPLERGVQVVDGVRSSGAGPIAPPTTGWNEMGARELRPLIKSGQIGDPTVALTYEATHRKRAQVMTALSMAIAAQGGDPDPDDDDGLPAAEHSTPLPEEGVA